MILGTYFDVIAIISIVAGVLSSTIIFLDIKKNPQKMSVMNPVWIINALWGSIFVLWFYFSYARNSKANTQSMEKMMDMTNINMDTINKDKILDDHMEKSSNQKSDSIGFCRKIVTSTMHCGAGCTLADFIGAIIFSIIPLTLFNSKIAAEWTVDFILALIIGVSFQYYAIAPMLKKTGFNIWIKALKIDFLSLTSWQIGMYGFRIVTIVTMSSHTLLVGSFRYWFLMQIAMFFGFLTSYPVNWWLVKSKIKLVME